MTARLAHIEVDLGDAPAPSPELRQEQQVAVFDLLEENSFALPDGAPPGPYALILGRDGPRLTFHLTAAQAPAASFDLALGPLRQIVKDYHDICSSYYEAVKTAGASEIESFDEARRGIHHEGARVLQGRLAGKAEVDLETARRLFTLVCVILSNG